jgi:hypothetical protein
MWCRRRFGSWFYSPQITSWFPQGMRVLRQCKVPRAEVMFVTIKRKNIRPSKKKWTMLLQCLSCPMFAVRLWITTSRYRWSIWSLRPSACCVLPPHCTKDVYTPQGSSRYLWTVLPSSWDCFYDMFLVVLVTAIGIEPGTCRMLR